MPFRLTCKDHSGIKISVLGQTATSQDGNVIRNNDQRAIGVRTYLETSAGTSMPSRGDLWQSNLELGCPGSYPAESKRSNQTNPQHTDHHHHTISIHSHFSTFSSRSQIITNTFPWRKINHLSQRRMPMYSPEAESILRLRVEARRTLREYWYRKR